MSVFGIIDKINKVTKPRGITKKNLAWSIDKGLKDQEFFLAAFMFLRLVLIFSILYQKLTFY